MKTETAGAENDPFADGNELETTYARAFCKAFCGGGCYKGT